VPWASPTRIRSSAAGVAAGGFDEGVDVLGAGVKRQDQPDDVFATAFIKPETVGL